METLFNQPVDWPAILSAHRRILCLGLGGGSDAITAYWTAKILENLGANAVHYGNTRGTFDAATQEYSPHIAYFEGPPVPLSGKAAHGTSQIDRSLPRGPGHSPWLFRYHKSFGPDEEAMLVQELDALNYDLIVGVDTGGDVLVGGRRFNRDRAVARVVERVQARGLIWVIAPCSDGTVRDRVVKGAQRWVEAGAYLGAMDLTPYAAILREASTGLPESRTPQIMLRALDNLQAVERVPRGSWPKIPNRWLWQGLCFRSGVTSTKTVDK